jgi:Flp pilus assembly protein TadB
VVVHLSVAIGRFFEALLYAIFSVALWAGLELLAGVAALVVAIVLARRLLKRARRRP